eukprot:1162098-Pelagomonas_calceolata.AAC.6
MTPPKRAKECRLDNFLMRPAQAERAHRMLAIHVIKGPPFCAIFSQLKPAPSFLCSLTHPKSCYQHTSLHTVAAAERN